MFHSRPGPAGRGKMRSIAPRVPGRYRLRPAIVRCLRCASACHESARCAWPVGGMPRALSQRAKGRWRALLKLLNRRAAAALAEAVNVSKLLSIEGQPIQQAVQAACFEKFLPGARADMGQGQSLLAAEPGQAREELAFASRRRLPATQGMEVGCQRHVQFSAFGAAQHHAIEPGNGQAGEADGHLIAGADIQCLPSVAGS